MITREFEAEYKKLNKAQKEAVDSIEGPTMVIAGPGTGKTTILTLRIANILRLTDTPASGILALTFTEAGAKNMRLKLREIIGGRADEVRIHTFHGFAASVIAEFSDHFPHLHRASQITDVEAESLIRKILREEKFAKLRPLGDPDFYLSSILSTISDAKQEAQTPEMVRDFALNEIEIIKNDPESISTRGGSKGNLKADVLKRIEKAERTIVLADVYAKYEEEKKSPSAGGRKIDFDDLIFELLKALGQDKLLLQMLQEKFLYILLDEHQDTNDTQNLIVHQIANFFENPNLFVVGDEKQAIYRFQGASVENFLSFQKTWPSMKVISLTENYRSTQNILDASFKMIEENYGGGNNDQYKNLRVKLLSKTAREEKPIEIVTAENQDAENKYIVENINNILKEEPAAEIAVIVRRNREVESLLNLFEQNNIKAKAERGADIFSHPVGVLFFAFLEFLFDNSKVESLAKTIGAGMWHLPFEKQIDLIKQIRKWDLKGLEKEIPIISKIKKEMNAGNAIGSLITAADLSGFTKIIKQEPLSVEVWRGLLNLAESIAFQNEIENPIQLIERLLEYRATALRKSIKITGGDSRAQVSVMTAHGSKGLEFDYVFLPYASEEVWVGRKRGSFFVLKEEAVEGDNIKDERRLFYVAITRAKKGVSISLSLEDVSQKLLTPIRFISELDPVNVKHTDLPAFEKPITPITEEILNKRYKEKEIDYAKNVLLENGLSVTALNHFINSKEEFFEKCILRVPEAPTPSSEKGSAMHEAISRVWKNRGEKGVEETIKESIKQYFSKSFLPKYEKEILVKELLIDAKAVAECLMPHFSLEGRVYTEMVVDAPFGEITLHGRLDTVIEQENKILVFDYKTREGMSEKAIRGETQNDDGNYFRQLTFYKLLLSENPRWKEKIKNKSSEFSLIFIRPDSKGRCPTVTLEVTDTDIEKTKQEINTLLEAVWSGELLRI